MKLLPKGISRFTEIIDQSKYFVDRTPYIGKLDSSGENFLFFVRPRRFGKSVFIDMLEAYYDIAQKERFGHYFRDTWIYDHVTPEQGKYQVIHLDFSKITANLENIEDEFNVIVGYDIEDHARKYRVMYDDDFIPKMESFVTAKAKLNHFCTQARRRGYSLYLLVDEYDNFTNAVLSSAGKAGYLEITHGTGFYREFFKVVKTGFQKIFMTGIAPVTMDDLTSGFNIATNITLNPKYNGMMGFSVAEIREIIEYYRGEGKLAGLDTEEIIAEMAPWYDNYCFSEDAFSSHDQVFNSYMVTTFLSELADSGRIQRIRGIYRKNNPWQDLPIPDCRKFSGRGASVSCQFSELPFLSGHADCYRGGWSNARSGNTERKCQDSVLFISAEMCEGYRLGDSFRNGSTGTECGYGWQYQTVNRIHSGSMCQIFRKPAA